MESGIADELRQVAARGALSTVLTLAENLPIIGDRFAVDPMGSVNSLDF